MSKVFLLIGIEFPSDREYFLIEIYIYILRLVLLQKWDRRSEVGNKWNNKSSETIFCSVPHPVPLVWLFVYSNHFSFVRLDISQSVQNYNWICEGRVSLFLLPIFLVEFSLSLVRWDLPFFRIISSSNFLHTIHHICWMDGSFTFNKNSIPYCAWGITTNISHIWYCFL